jgi:hypothetical protein
LGFSTKPESKNDGISIVLPDNVGNMQDNAAEKIILGAFLILVGLAIILFHRSIKERYDWWQSRDWPAGLGESWTGKYTRGGLIFTYAVIILVGVVFLAIGISQLVGALTS